MIQMIDLLFFVLLHGGKMVQTQTNIGINLFRYNYSNRKPRMYVFGGIAGGTCKIAAHLTWMTTRTICCRYIKTKQYILMFFLNYVNTDGVINCFFISTFERK